MTKNLFQEHANQWQQHHNNRYNSDIALYDDQIEQMTNNIALVNKMVKDTDYILKQITFNDTSPIENALEAYNIPQEVQSKKPIILQICNGKHWITMGLLPNPNKNNEYFAVKMNSYIPNELKDIGKFEDMTDEENKKLIEKQYKRRKKECKEKMVDPDPTENIIQSLKGLKCITNLDMQPEQQSLTISSDVDEEFFDTVNAKVAIDLSVNQQLKQNCGLMTAANSFSILKTYNELKNSNSNIFVNPKTFVYNFKTALEKHVFYEKKEGGKLYVLGKETDLKEGAVVQIIGQAVLEGKCTNEEIEEKANAQLIKKLLLEDAMESCSDEERSNTLINTKKSLEDGKLTDAEFDKALINAGLTLAEYVQKEQRLPQNRQDNNHDIASESWSEMINKTVQNDKENLPRRQ